MAQDVEASVIPRQHVHSAHPALDAQEQHRMRVKNVQGKAPVAAGLKTETVIVESLIRAGVSEKADDGTVVEFSRLTDAPSQRVQLVPRRQVERNNAWLPEMSSMSPSLGGAIVEQTSNCDDLNEDGHVHVDRIVINPLNGRASIL